MKLVQGFGVNDADYVVSSIVDGKRVKCLAYRAWQNMIKRCYSEKYQERWTTYIGVTVCDEWRSFMKFREWWLENHVDGWHLDKDLLTDNRQYSPDSCIYVPAWLNCFNLDSGASRGQCPIGVSYHIRDKSFVSLCCNPKTGRREHLGYFKTKEPARIAWMSRKIELAAQMKADMDAIDKRIYPRAVEIIKRAS